ncbi:hypothetical protein YC2023_081494 [Brassica napus]
MRWKQAFWKQDSVSCYKVPIPIPVPNREADVNYIDINLLRLFRDNRLLSSVVLIEIFLVVFDIVNLSVSGGKVFGN